MSATTSIPDYGSTGFTQALLDHLPTGPIWPRETDTVIYQVCEALMQQYERLHLRSVNLLSDAFPVAPVELLPEWQLTLGLPDPCAGPTPTLQQEQQQVAARFVASGGQSQAYFINLAANLGYAVTITQFAPVRAGRPCGQPCYGPPWAHAWQVNAPTFTIERFVAGHNSAGDPLSIWGNTVLQCELQRLAPAHTVLLFAYF